MSFELVLAWLHPQKFYNPPLRNAHVLRAGIGEASSSNVVYAASKTCVSLKGSPFGPETLRLDRECLCDRVIVLRICVVLVHRDYVELIMYAVQKFVTDACLMQRLGR